MGASSRHDNFYDTVVPRLARTLGAKVDHDDPMFWRLSFPKAGSPSKSGANVKDITDEILEVVDTPRGEGVALFAGGDDKVTNLAAVALQKRLRELAGAHEEGFNVNELKGHEFRKKAAEDFGLDWQPGETTAEDALRLKGLESQKAWIQKNFGKEQADKTDFFEWDDHDPGLSGTPDYWHGNMVQVPGGTLSTTARMNGRIVHEFTPDDAAAMTQDQKYEGALRTEQFKGLPMASTREQAENIVNSQEQWKSLHRIGDVTKEELDRHLASTETSLAELKKKDPSLCIDCFRESAPGDSKALDIKHMKQSIGWLEDDLKVADKDGKAHITEQIKGLRDAIAKREQDLLVSGVPVTGGDPESRTVPEGESNMKDITEDIIGTIDKPQGEVRDITEQVMANPSNTSVVSMTTPPVIDEAPPPAAVKAQTSGWKQAFGRATYQRFIDNFLSTPDLIASQAQRVVLPPVVNAAMDFAGVRPEIPQMKGNILPTGEQVMAGAQVAKSAIQGQPVSFEEAEAAGREVAAAHPTATMAGTLTGDALTLFTGKAPIARFARNARVHNMNVINPEPWKAVAPGTAQLISRVVNSTPIQRLGRGLGRSMEAGIEGAVLSTLNGSDPVETAALAAGGQTAGSMALSILPKSVKGFGVFGGTVVGMWALVRLLQDILPGGETGSAGAALDTVMAKLKWGLIAGGTAALAGAGRIKTNTLANAWPEVAEALTQLPRGAIISAWSEFARDKETGPGFIEPITKEIAENPQNFTPYERDRIVRAMKSNKESISSTIQDLMKRSPEFTKQVQAIMENTR